MNLFGILLTVLCGLIGCSAHNILAFLPLPIWSHYVQVEPIFHARALRGHNVTVVSPYSPKQNTPNLKHFPLAVDISALRKRNPMERALEKSHEFFKILTWMRLAESLVPQVLESTVFQDLVHGDNQFDLVFTELFFGQEALVILGHIFNAPVVTYSSFGYQADILRYTGAANAVSYIPEKELDYAGPMSLIQRLDNALIQYAAMIFSEYWYYPRHDILLSNYIPGNLPRISDMLRNVSLFFLTANTAIDGARFYPPHVIEISGIHLKEPSSLDEELKVVMNNAESGVIFICFGSILKMSYFRKEAIQTFLTIFKELDQTVLWKTDLNSSDWDIPKNVYLRDWFDQTSILAHPNCVLFLTHGGVSSMMEAIKHAVPMVGMPFYGDQILNLANAEYNGYGVRVLYPNLTQNSLRSAIKTVLGDPRFKENISKASRIFTDKPLSSLDTAVFWIEYLIRHKGAHHLKPLALQIPWYQLFLLDVIVLYSTLFIALLYFITKLSLLLFRKFASKSTYSKEKKI